MKIFSSINSAVTVLNNLKVEDCENDEYSPVKVLDALTLHGWKISPEEQVRSTPMRFCLIFRQKFWCGALTNAWEFVVVATLIVVIFRACFGTGCT